MTGTQVSTLPEDFGCAFLPVEEAKLCVRTRLLPATVLRLDPTARPGPQQSPAFEGVVCPCRLLTGERLAQFCARNPWISALKGALLEGGTTLFIRPPAVVTVGKLASFPGIAQEAASTWFRAATLY